MTSDPAPIAYNVRDAAAACGMSPDTIYRAVKGGLLPAKRTGSSRRGDGRPTGKILILRRDLEHWIENLPDD